MDSQVVDDVWMAAGERSLVEEGGGVAVGGGGRADARWRMAVMTGRLYIYNAWAWVGPGSAWARGLARGAGRVACAPTKQRQTPCAWACDMVGA